MARRQKQDDHSQDTHDATTGYEAELWSMADALRGSMDAAEYKHVVLGLIFLKYISDAFEEMHARLEAERAEGADPEDPDEYRAENIFWVPPEARWAQLKAQARQRARSGRQRWSLAPALRPTKCWWEPLSEGRSRRPVCRNGLSGPVVLFCQRGQGRPGM